jgi:signal transduction histidine kinase
LLVIAGLALVYVLSARLLISLSAVPSGPVTTVWLPSGIAVAVLVMFGPWAAAGSLLGNVILALNMHTPAPVALLLSLGNAGGELLCYGLLTQGGKRGFSIDEVLDGARLAGAAAAAGLLSAAVSVTAFIHYGMIPAQAFLENGLVWMGSTVSSIVVVVPLLVFIAKPWPQLHARWEYAASLALLAVTAYLWQGPVFTRDADEPVLLLLILGQLWIAFRFFPFAVTLANGTITAAAVAACVMRLGEAPPATSYPSILSLQFMLAGVALLGYLLASMVERQRRSTRALADAQSVLLSSARHAGRAEIATNVLHNVGNVLNSVNVSAGMLASRLRTSKAQGLSRVAQMLDANQADLGHFLAHDEKGRLLPGYLGQVAAALEQEQRDMSGELAQLARNIDHIKDVVATQQTYAGTSTLLEPAQMQDLVEDALRLEADALERAQVKVVREFGNVPLTRLDKARVVQVVVNLVSNARLAMAETRIDERTLVVSVQTVGESLQVRVSDAGEGITADNLTRIFSHGFTTRATGHGFGLHSCALAARAMGGSLAVHSAGVGQGASFTLQLPLGTAIAP